MQRCLNIPELITEIFGYLSVHGHDDQRWKYGDGGCGRRDFAALARTCKLFYEPACNFLWSDQPFGLLPLFCLLPKFCDVQTRTDSVDFIVDRNDGKLFVDKWASDLASSPVSVSDVLLAGDLRSHRCSRDAHFGRLAAIYKAR
jgi:hypothetical protein